ncbi:SAC3 domain-containing protein 1-like isoform X2 [Ornithodoros turicata]|uniref:SAC3 domain-containing protein 1-like isoform X2 n=1 Tax=Ornithodoros turicata TaxID=34597 RepID=UPI0031387C0D
MSAIAGRCLDMCPLKEREWRERERLLHPFEVLDGTAHQARPKADPCKTVKIFTRSAAGQHLANPGNLRPPPVLLKTSEYLMNIVSSNKAEFIEVYKFAWDRLWSLRQDMTIQQASGKECVTVLEQAVRFYVYSSFRACSEKSSHFDSYINAQHLQECLKRLLVMYQESADACPNRPEMEAMYLLHNLGSVEALSHCITMPRNVRSSVLVQRSADISAAYLDGNFVRLLRYYRKLPFLLACCLHQHLNKIRMHALQILNVAYSSQNCKFPQHDLSHWLQCTVEETKDLCIFHELTVLSDTVKFLKSTGKFQQGQEMRKTQDPVLKSRMKALDTTLLLTTGTESESRNQNKHS